MFVSRQLCFRRIINTLTGKGRDVLPDKKYAVGADHLGNVYFEVPSQAGRPKRLSSMGISNNSTSEEKVKAFRGDLDMGSSKGRMPVEWQQWLRHTRRDPPTNHDILMNEALSMRTKQRAIESDRKHQIWKEKKLAEEEEAKKAPEMSKNFKDEFYVNPEDDIEEWSPGK